MDASRIALFGRFTRVAVLVAATAAALAGRAAAAAPAPSAYTLERVVMVMRHGVRPPTKAQPMAVGIARDAWPSWSVKPGYLTEHGGRGVNLLGRFDRGALAASGLVPATGCPAPGAVRVWADTDERTIRTGETWLAGFAPDCAIENGHLKEGEVDPVFSAIEAGAVPYHAEAAHAAVRARLGPKGLAPTVRAHRDALDRLQRVLGCCARPICADAGAAPPCGLIDLEAELAQAEAGKRPRLKGSLDLGSTASEILLLQYTEGKPMADVGWGRASPEDIRVILALHPLEFDLVARPPYVAGRNAAFLAKAIMEGLAPKAGTGPGVTLLVGHDTNLANMGGMLDVHWTIADYPRDDPPPGGALGFEALRDRAGQRYVRVFFRAQSMSQLRDLTPLDAANPPAKTYLPMACGSPRDRTLCRLDAFERLVRRALPPEMSLR